MRNKKLYSCLFLLVTLFYQPAEAIDKKAYIADFATLYAKDWVALFAHQLGQALTAKALVGGAVHMHLGCNRTNTKHFTLPVTIGKTTIELNSVLPCKGWTTHQDKCSSRWKNVAITVAGPICGAVAHYLMTLCYNTIKEKKIDLGVLTKSLLGDPDIFLELTKHLIPTEDNDGAQILHEFFPKIDTYNIIWQILAALAQSKAEWEMVKRLNTKAPGEENKNKYETLFIHNYNAHDGHRVLMELTNDTIGTLKNAVSKEYFNLCDIDITFGDIFSVIGLYRHYPDALRAMFPDKES